MRGDRFCDRPRRGGRERLGSPSPVVARRMFLPLPRYKWKLCIGEIWSNENQREEKKPPTHRTWRKEFFRGRPLGWPRAPRRGRPSHSGSHGEPHRTISLQWNIHLLYKITQIIRNCAGRSVRHEATAIQRRQSRQWNRPRRTPSFHLLCITIISCNKMRSMEINDGGREGTGDRAISERVLFARNADPRRPRARVNHRHLHCPLLHSIRIYQ